MIGPGIGSWPARRARMDPAATAMATDDEALSVCLHKSNVYIDLSGWSPKYFPPQLVRAANGLLRTKVLFGSDYPLLRPERWLADFDQLDIKPEVKPLIMKENAVRALQLDA